jgi:TonB family protein
MQYDTPPQVKIAVASVYPYQSLTNQKSGSATVAFLVAPDGRVRECRVIESSAPDFGLAAKAMMEAWTFEPATKDKQPIWSRLSRKVAFNWHDRDAVLTEDAQRLLDESTRTKPRIYTLGELDAMPRPLYRPMPVYPAELAKQGVTDTVVVEMYIDANGAAQLPRAIKFTNEDFAWSAVTAAARWHFEAPLHNGKPVDAIVRMPFAFKPKSPTNPGGGEQPGGDK